MRKLISTKYESSDNVQTDEYIIPNPEWMNEIGNKYYFIWAPQTNRRTDLEVVFGEITRDYCGYPKVLAKYLDKPKHDAYWDNFFPSYSYIDACEFMGIDVNKDMYYSCLVFDNEVEARAYCSEYNEWKNNKYKRLEEERLRSDESVKKHTKRLQLIKDLISTIDINDINTYWKIDTLFEGAANQLNWYKEELSK